LAYEKLSARKIIVALFPILLACNNARLRIFGESAGGNSPAIPRPTTLQAGAR